MSESVIVPAPVVLTEAQKAAVARLTRDIPAPREMVGGEVSGLQQEAMDGYAYGERMRYDTQGRQWTFRRVAVNDQWQMQMSVSYFGIDLGFGAVPLDVVAGTDGEERMLDMVAYLCQEIGQIQQACVDEQMAMQADSAVAPLSEPPPATSPDPVTPPEQPTEPAPTA